MQNSFKVLILVLLCSLFACSVPPTPEPPTPTVGVVTRTRTPGAAIASPSPVTSATIFKTSTPSRVISLTPTPRVTRTSTTVPSRTATPPPTLTSLGGCAEIWQPGFYRMYADAKTTIKRFDCMIVQASDVVIDCDGHTIEGIDKQGHGFWIRRYGFPLLQTPNNVEIRNCKVTNALDGVFAEAGTNLYIHDNDFSSNFDDTNQDRYGIFLGMTAGGGIRLDKVVGARVERNVLNGSAIGVDLRDSDKIVVRDNIAESNSAWGINLLNTSNSQILNNTLKANVRWCTWGDGKSKGRGCDAAAIIMQDGSSNNLVKGNSITGENANGVFIKAHGVRCGDNNRIEGNRIIDTVYNAVEFSFCKDNQVVGNDMSGSFDAVWFGFSTNTLVADNVIRDMRNHGIISYNSRNSVIRNNHVINAREGIYFYWEAWDAKKYYFLPSSSDQYASRDNKIEGNHLQDNAVAAIHLSNSIQNQVQNNDFVNNGIVILVEGRNEGNIFDVQ